MARLRLEDRRPVFDVIPTTKLPGVFPLPIVNDIPIAPCRPSHRDLLTEYQTLRVNRERLLPREAMDRLDADNKPLFADEIALCAAKFTTHAFGKGFSIYYEAKRDLINKRVYFLAENKKQRLVIESRMKELETVFELKPVDVSVPDEELEAEDYIFRGSMSVAPERHIWPKHLLKLLEEEDRPRSKTTQSSSSGMRALVGLHIPLYRSSTQALRERRKQELRPLAHSPSPLRSVLKNQESRHRCKRVPRELTSLELMVKRDREMAERTRLREEAKAEEEKRRRKKRQAEHYRVEAYLWTKRGWDVEDKKEAVREASRAISAERE